MGIDTFADWLQKSGNCVTWFMSVIEAQSKWVEFCNMIHKCHRSSEQMGRKANCHFFSVGSWSRDVWPSHLVSQNDSTLLVVFLELKWKVFGELHVKVYFWFQWSHVTKLCVYTLSFINLYGRPWPAILSWAINVRLHSIGCLWQELMKMAAGVFFFCLHIHPFNKDFLYTFDLFHCLYGVNLTEMLLLFHLHFFCP
jgi:hypothetical protein